MLNSVAGVSELIRGRVGRSRSGLAQNPSGLSEEWEQPLETLRAKWGTIPLHDRRADSAALLELSDEELLTLWRTQRDLEGAFDLRGWFRLLYRDTVPGKRILDIGCGFAYDSLTFAEQGAEVTLVDIVQENIELVARVASLLGVDVRTVFMSSLTTLSGLPTDYDIVMAMGSLHNAPESVMRPEYQELTRRLRPGGRWWQLAYPKVRWEREGALPFDEWGPHTDGPGTPWEEWLDVPKLLDLLAPAPFELVFYTEWHNRDFNWFDLVLPVPS
jgi:SAM-dependent methyltransferase